MPGCTLSLQTHASHHGDKDGLRSPRPRHMRSSAALGQHHLQPGLSSQTASPKPHSPSAGPQVCPVASGGESPSSREQPFPAVKPTPAPPAPPHRPALERSGHTDVSSTGSHCSGRAGRQAEWAQLSGRESGCPGKPRRPHCTLAGIFPRLRSWSLAVFERPLSLLFASPTNLSPSHVARRPGQALDGPHSSNYSGNRGPQTDVLRQASPSVRAAPLLRVGPYNRVSLLSNGQILLPTLPYSWLKPPSVCVLAVSEMGTLPPATPTACGPLCGPAPPRQCPETPGAKTPLKQYSSCGRAVKLCLAPAPRTEAERTWAPPQPRSVGGEPSHPRTHRVRSEATASTAPFLGHPQLTGAGKHAVQQTSELASVAGALREQLETRESAIFRSKPPNFIQFP